MTGSEVSRPIPGASNIRPQGGHDVMPGHVVLLMPVPNQFTSGCIVAHRNTPGRPHQLHIAVHKVA